MTCLLDTHFLLWIVLDTPRLAEFPWLQRYAPWGVSPISLLEVQCLGEIGKLGVDIQRFTRAIMDDPRFLMDEVPLLNLIHQALPLSWTQDPFDRLLAAHSAARRVPLCTVDRQLRAHHAWIPAELTV